MQRLCPAVFCAFGLLSSALLLIAFVPPIWGADMFQVVAAKQAGCGTVDAAFPEAQCLRLSFAGELSSGQTFERKFGEKLSFRLNPKTARSGWMIEVIPDVQDEKGQQEYVWVVNPPYRSYNVRHLDTSYGTNAREAVDYSPRLFNFVLSEEQFNRAAGLVDLAIMSRPQSEQRTREELDKEWEDARRALMALPVSKGRLTILDSHITESTGDRDFGSIEWLKFKVELQVPCGFVSASGSDLTIDASKCKGERKQNQD